MERVELQFRGADYQATVFKAGRQVDVQTGELGKLHAWILSQHPGARVTVTRPITSLQPPGKRSAGAAAALAELWHGRPATTVREVSDQVHVHRHLADLGRLVALEIFVGSTDRVNNIEFTPADNVRLAASEYAGTRPDGSQGRFHQLYFVGGNQQLDRDILAAFGLGPDELAKERIVLGAAYTISYWARKAVQRFRPAEYIHQFGEERGFLPVVIYRPLDRDLELVGGSYRIEDVGIVN
jgi:hypothetical protein